MDFRSAGGWLRLVITTTGGRASVKSVAVSVHTQPRGWVEGGE